MHWHLAFPRLFWLFGAFIFSCGATHVMEAVIFYHPAYRFAALLKIITAVASWATVFALFRIAPKALKLPGLSRANDELQEQLSNTRRAEEALARSNHHLESFTGLVTHDLRNPLHSALLRSEVAREAVERGDAALASTQLRLSMDSMRQMEALVKELHAEALLRNSATEMGPVALSSVVGAARTNLAPLIATSGARIVAGPLPEIHGSRTMLIQLFINLCENSINLNIIGREFAEEEERQFEKDKRDAIEVTYESWCRRPVGQRVAGAVAALVRSQL